MIWKEPIDYIKHLSKTKEFFSKVDIKGTLDARVQTVVDFFQPDYCDLYFCFAGIPPLLAWKIHSTNISQFENNGFTYIIGTLSNLKRIDDFKRKVIKSIDSAELKGGTVSEKRDRFLEVFPGDVNIYVYDSAYIGRYFSFNFDFYYEPNEIFQELFPPPLRLSSFNYNNNKIVISNCENFKANFLNSQKKFISENKKNCIHNKITKLLQPFEGSSYVKIENVKSFITGISKENTEDYLVSENNNCDKEKNNKILNEKNYIKEDNYNNIIFSQVQNEKEKFYENLNENKIYEIKIKNFCCKNKKCRNYKNKENITDNLNECDKKNNNFSNKLKNEKDICLKGKYSNEINYKITNTSSNLIPENIKKSSNENIFDISNKTLNVDDFLNFSDKNNDKIKENYNFFKNEILSSSNPKENSEENSEKITQINSNKKLNLNLGLDDQDFNETPDNNYNIEEKESKSYKESINLSCKNENEIINSRTSSSTYNNNTINKQNNLNNFENSINLETPNAKNLYFNHNNTNSPFVGLNSEITKIYLNSKPEFREINNFPPEENFQEEENKTTSFCDCDNFYFPEFELNYGKTADDFRRNYIARLVCNNIWQPKNKQKNHNSIIIFDWDDTLLCTTFLTPNGIFYDNLKIEKTGLEKIARLESLVFNILNSSIEKGETFIITNAAPGWVEYSAKRFYPKVFSILPKITILSARGEFEKIHPGDSRQWKILTFRKLLNIFDTSLITNLICLVDSLIEMEAAHVLISKFKNGFIKTVKFRENPTPEELYKQLHLIVDQYNIIFSAVKNLTIKVEKKSKNPNKTANTSYNNSNFDTSQIRNSIQSICSTGEKKK